MVGPRRFEPDSFHIAPYRRVLMCRDFSNLRECLSHLVSVCRAVVAHRWHKYRAVPIVPLTDAKLSAGRPTIASCLVFILGTPNVAFQIFAITWCPSRTLKAHQLIMTSVLTL